MPMGHYVPLEVRFWAYVDKLSEGDACWLWRGALCGGVTCRYGQIRGEGGGRKVLAHRVSWELAHGVRFDPRGDAGAAYLRQFAVRSARASVPGHAPGELGGHGGEGARSGRPS